MYNSSIKSLTYNATDLIIQQKHRNALKIYCIFVKHYRILCLKLRVR